MKKSFSLVEVLVAITLLSVVITTIFQVKENNLFFLEKFKNSSKNNELISITTIIPIDFKSIRNENVYLDKVIDFKDDDIRKKLKLLKVNIKDEVLDEKDLSSDDVMLKLTTLKRTYKIENKITSNIYTFKLDY